MADYNLEELREQLSSNILKIKNISHYDNYFAEIDEKIMSLESEKKSIDDNWKTNDLRLDDLNEIISKKMFIDENDQFEKHSEFMNLLVLFSEKEAEKKKIDARIEQLQNKKNEDKEKVKSAIDALYMFMIDVEKDNLELLRSMGIEKDNSSLSKIKSDETPEYYADSSKVIEIYFKRIEAVSRRIDKYKNRISKLEDRLNSFDRNINMVNKAIRIAKESGNPGEDLDNGHEDLINLFILRGETENKIKKYKELIAKYEAINSRMITNVTKAINRLGDILDGFKKSTGILFQNDVEEVPKKFDPNFEFDTVILPEEERETVKITVLLGEDKEPVIVEREKGDVLEMGIDPKAEDGYEFTGWTIDGKPIDPDMPLTKDITVKANYEKINYCNVNLRNSKGDIIKTLKVRFGEKIEGLYDELIPKKRFKQFDCWEIISEHEEINGAMYDPESQVIGDLDLKATYTIDRKRIIAIAAGVATAALATAADLVVSSQVGPTDGAFSKASATINGVLAIGAAVGLKKFKEPNYAKEEEVKGIRKAGLKVANHFRNKDNLRNWRDYFITSSALSAVSALVQSLSGATSAKEADDNIKIFEDIPEEPTKAVKSTAASTTTNNSMGNVETFKGTDANSPIYQDKYLEISNGRPNMSAIGDDGIVRYFDATGKEISTDTPLSEIVGPIKIVEGSEVMGYQAGPRL